MDKILSVVIPTYNRKELTDRAVQSVISKTPELVEIIVVDDGGRDVYFWNNRYNSSNIEVRVYRSKINGGAGMARKLGISNANGKFIAFLDSDDIFCVDWVDHLIDKIIMGGLINDQVIFVGKVIGGQFIANCANSVLRFLREGNRIIAAKIITVFFNPFYTPSLVVKKEICSFKDNLRYCEDFYTNAFAIFSAKKIFMENVFACELGRAPNSEGGLSGGKTRMLKGEVKVRFEMMLMRNVGFPYKFILPFGFLYQLIRELVKILVNFFRKIGG